jgi:putative copper resistance protein D
VIAGLIDVFGFLAVLCRGLTLALAALTAGGVSFSLITWRYATRGTASEAQEKAARGIRRWIACSAVALAVTQSLWLAANSAVLMETAGLDFAGVWGADYFISGILMIGSAVMALVVLRSSQFPQPLLWIPAAGTLAADVMTSHSAARMDSQVWLIGMTAAHQAATAVWIGAIPYWLLALRSIDDRRLVSRVCARFSRSAQVSMGALLAAGVGLTLFYVPSRAALAGTSYGAMVVAKIVLFTFVLALGALNFFAIRSGGAPDHIALARLRRFGEAEVGIGFTVILAAASLTAQPPSADLTTQIVPAQKIVERMSPRAPRMQTPPLSSLSPSSLEIWKREQAQREQPQPYIPGAAPYTPPTEGDIAWSEYNHHWAGMIVLAAGLLAVLGRNSRMRWARHWPLAFIGLAVFLLIRADPENWPLGPNGFWESFSSADVLQHRLFVVLILGFSFFEWGIRTGRVKWKPAALVFPLVCAAGGALLLTHTHALANVEEELLAELSHLPLALLAVVAGWTRWLELRLPASDQKIPSRIWPVCLALIGTVLLLYREA